MSQQDIAGVSVDVNEEGYLTDPTQWTRELAPELAKDVDINELTEEHWKVIEFLQRDYAENSVLPTIRRIKNTGGIPTKDLYRLFPGGPLKKAAKIAGLPKPESCI